MTVEREYQVPFETKFPLVMALDSRKTERASVGGTLIYPEKVEIIAQSAKQRNNWGTKYVEVHACNPSIWDVDAGWARVPGKLWPDSQTLSQEKRKGGRKGIPSKENVQSLFWTSTNLCVCMHLPHGGHVWRSENNFGVSSLLPPCGDGGSNSGYQA